jgi:hypothetical protein
MRQTKTLLQSNSNVIRSLCRYRFGSFSRIRESLLRIRKIRNFVLGSPQWLTA